MKISELCTFCAHTMPQCSQQASSLVSEAEGAVACFLHHSELQHAKQES